MNRRTSSDAGFTLVELLVVIAILAVIGPVVAGAVFLGFRSVGTTQNEVTGTAALGAFSSRFTADVQGSRTVDRLSPPARCSGVGGQVVVHLGSSAGDVYYTFDAADRTLTRYACGASTGPASAAVLGTFGAGAFGGGDADPTTEPVTLSCPTTQTPCTPASAVTVLVRTGATTPAVAVTASRLVSG